MPSGTLPGQGTWPRYLPLDDVTMITSTKPVFVTLLSCIFLKEACGVFEVVTLAMVVGGITLVIQPPFLFGGEVVYTPHMLTTAMVLLATTAFSSLVTIILRHLRSMHWAAINGSVRFITILEYLPFVLYLGLECVPACGEERLVLIFLAAIGTAVQTTMTLSLKVEEANVIGLVDSTASIIVAFLFQAAFFEVVAGPVKVAGGAVVLGAVVTIGARKVWAARRAGQLARQLKLT